MKNLFFVLSILVFTACSSDDRPNCLDVVHPNDFDPTIMSCEDIQAATTIDCTCD